MPIIIFVLPCVGIIAIRFKGLIMKQENVQKQNVAWFKIAQCIESGQKERALGMYRLLSHSIPDQAYAQQLEGDIFMSFDDIATAADLYHNAAQLYKKDGRLFEAALVYDHLATLQPIVYPHITHAIQLYQLLNQYSKVQQRVQLLVTRLAEAKQWQQAIDAIDLLSQDDTDTRLHLLQTILLEAIATNRPPELFIEFILQRIISTAQHSATPHALQKILTILETHQPERYHQALRMMTQHDPKNKFINEL